LWEIEQICHHSALTEKFFVERMGRVVRYFQQLETSFSVMVDGMEREQFLKFRMSLLPASGFQSAQYRLIEICSTDAINLVHVQHRAALKEYSDLDEQIQKLYWRSGATELASGKKTLTLQQFEEKYMKLFKETGIKYRDKNLWKLFHTKFSQSEELKKVLREFDQLANVLWPLAHLKSAGYYLQRDPEDIKATGGTNWQKYLPPRFQKIMFFPNLWSEQEIDEWGRAGVVKAFSK
ncbi:MAG: tryptophan 2,3-dioxygenase family protein, partial [Flammeovirgaceae bacterium]